MTRDGRRRRRRAAGASPAPTRRIPPPDRRAGRSRHLAGAEDGRAGRQAHRRRSPTPTPQYQAASPTSRRSARPRCRSPAPSSADTVRHPRPPSSSATSTPTWPPARERADEVPGRTSSPTTARTPTRRSSSGRRSSTASAGHRPERPRDERRLRRPRATAGRAAARAAIDTALTANTLDAIIDPVGHDDRHRRPRRLPADRRPRRATTAAPRPGRHRLQRRRLQRGPSCSRSPTPTSRRPSCARPAQRDQPGGLALLLRHSRARARPAGRSPPASRSTSRWRPRPSRSCSTS